MGGQFLIQHHLLRRAGQQIDNHRANEGGDDQAGGPADGAKQRAHVLLTQPEIRLRIEALRAERRAEHQRHLADAIEIVNGVIADAAQHS